MTSNVRTIVSAYEAVNISQGLEVYRHGDHHPLKYYQVFNDKIISSKKYLKN